MRAFSFSFCRLIVCLLVLTVLSSRIAMAAYICPDIVKAATPEMTGEIPCAEMDKAKPVECNEYRTGEKLALEHFAVAPTLTPPIASFVIPVFAPSVPAALASVWPDIPLESGADPPYLQTQRLRI